MNIFLGYALGTVCVYMLFHLFTLTLIGGGKDETGD